jgi:hypothetical protein
MIVNYLDLINVALSPDKADSPTVIDSDTIFPQAVSLEGFQAIARWNSQIIEVFRPVYHAQFA